MSTADPSTVLYEVVDNVAVLTLNRPARLNALTAEMGSRYNSGLMRADADPDVRVVVVTGAGRGFCAGAELDVVDAIGSGDQSAATPNDGLKPELAMSVRKPVIAAVNGSAAGAGMALLAYADVRFVAAEAKLTANFSQLGLAAEYGLSWTLSRLVGWGGATDLLLSGRRITGVEAGAMGLAQRVSPAADVLTTALEYARQISLSCAPLALATIKAQIVADLERPHAAAHESAAKLMARSFTSSDLAEVVRSRAEGRHPEFQRLEP